MMGKPTYLVKVILATLWVVDGGLISTATLRVSYRISSGAGECFAAVGSFQDIIPMRKNSPHVLAVTNKKSIALEITY